MEQQQVIEGNKLIAGFACGWKEGELFSFHNGSKGYIHISDLKYHASWDWIMSVVDKIEDTLSSPIGWVTIYGEKHWTEDVPNYFECIIANDDETVMSTLSHSSKIEAVWQAVVEYIKYYNSIQSK